MAKSKWNTNNIPDQKGRVIIITGSTSGIGKEAVRVLASKNASVIMAVRNVTKGEKVAEEIREQFGKAIIEVQHLDLTSLESIKQFADEFIKKHDQLDILINNAGIMMCPYGKTKDGFEIQMGTNHLGHFALTGYLMVLLKSTEDSRIVVLSSAGHTMGNIDINDINWENRKYDTNKAYGDSKLANLYFAYELSDRLKEEENAPKVTAAHPGWTETNLQRHSALMGFLNTFFAQSVEMGTLPSLRAAIDNKAEYGDYYGPSSFFGMHGNPTIVKSNKRSHDKEVAKKIWDLSEQLTGVKY